MLVQFSEVEIGVKFFDPYSGEYYVKVGDDIAVDVAYDEDHFEPTELVEV